MNEEKLKFIDTKFYELLSLLRKYINPDSYFQIQEFVDVGEYIVALDAIEFVVKEKKTIIPQDLLVAMQCLLKLLDDEIASPGEFPRDWSDDKIMHMISDIATDPNAKRIRIRNDRVLVKGTREEIEIEVILDYDKEGGGIFTGYSVCFPKPLSGKFFFNEIKEKFYDFLKGHLKSIFSEDLIKEIEHFVDVSEWGLALETLCYIIVEENLLISPTIRDEIKNLFEIMEKDQSLYKKILPYVK